MNEANAILIIGAIALHLICGLHLIVTVALVGFGIATWCIIESDDKKLLEAQIDYWKAKAEYYKRVVK